MNEHAPVRTLPGNQCVVHGFHRPTPLRTVQHHIFPQEYGGPTNADNLVMVCDTGHYNIHAVLDALIKGQTPPKASRRETQLAQLGYQRIQESRKAR